MITIDPTYRVILTYSPIIEVTGHIFECFDYFLFLRQFVKTGILFFSCLTHEKLKALWNSKYNVDFSIVENDLIEINIHNTTSMNIIAFGINTNVIITDGNIKSFEHNNIFLASKHLYGFLCEYDQFEKVKLNKNIIFMQDYRIYGKNKYFKSIDYVKKIPYKFYKHALSPNKNIGLIYMTYVCRKVYPGVIKDYHQRSGCTKSLLVVPYKLPEYDNIDNIEQIEAPVDNLFDRFDTYIYTPVNRKFDCSPRLITECFIHNKNVFKQLDYYDIGLETRYNDCVNNLEFLNLTDTDKILEILNI